MSLLRSSLSLTLSLSLALPSVAMAGPPPPPPPKGTATSPDQPPDPNTVSAEEKLKWAKKLFQEASAAHEAEDFYNSVIKFEQAYTFAPDKHIFAYNIGQDAWELKDCARVKQYLELFLIKETAKEDLRKKAQELLAKADGNAECVTGNTSSQPSNPTQPKTSAPVEGGEGPELTRRNRNDDDAIEDDGPKKRGSSGLLIGGVIMTVAGIGAAGAGIGTMFAAKSKAAAATDAADVGPNTNFPQGRYDDDVQGQVKSAKTLNLVSPILIGVGGALLIGGIVMIVIDRGNKKKGKGFYANTGRRVQLTGLGAAPLPGGGATGSLALSF